MAKLGRETIRKLAVLRALLLWRKGAYGPVRLHKTMFAADKANQRRLFTFKKYYLGQYSEQISAALNSLRAAGRLSCLFDGPAERLKAVVPATAQTKIKRLFTQEFPAWEKNLVRAFPEWGYLSNNQILKKAHEDASFTETQHDQVIFESTLPETIDLPSLTKEAAEELSDLVDEKLAALLRKRILAAVKVPAEETDWRHIYFGEPAKSKKAV